MAREWFIGSLSQSWMEKYPYGFEIYIKNEGNPDTLSGYDPVWAETLIYKYSARCCKGDTIISD